MEPNNRATLRAAARLKHSVTRRWSLFERRDLRQNDLSSAGRNPIRNAGFPLKLPEDPPSQPFPSAPHSLRQDMAKLYFYYSAMNAGKSTTLLQSAHNYEERGMNVVLFTPQLDDRAGVGQIASRIGLNRQAIAFPADHDLFVDIRDRHRESPIHCVLIDEAQFLTPRQVLQLTLVCDRLDIPVLCYGLRTDFRGEPFEGSKYLLAWADDLVELKTICHSGKKATMNARLDADGNRVWSGLQIEIGNHYAALSRREFQLDRVSPVGYTAPEDQSGQAGD